MAWLPANGTIVYPDGQRYPKGGYDAAALTEQITHARMQGVNGFCIFELGRSRADDGPLVTALTTKNTTNAPDTPFINKAPSCL
jgi:hypothetical protein